MANSELSWQRLLKNTPNGCQTLSKMPSRYINGVYPKVLERGKGGHVWDEEGNEFIDLIAGLGAVSVGYANEAVNYAAIKQMEKGVSFSLPNSIEAEAAGRLTQLVPSTEMWKFFKTGSDADTAAVRCARAFTNRDKILTCGYHGWHSWYSIQNDKKAGIVRDLAKYVNKAIYNKIETFDCLKSKEFAAVIIEPMIFEYPTEEFHGQLRKLCDETGTLLIWDEVVTGGRYRNFVAQRDFKIVPDLTVLSKGIANGFPLAGVGGSRRIMQTFERDDFFVSGTFGGEAVSLAACLATVDVLQSALPKMIDMGEHIKDYFNYTFRHIKSECKGYPTRLTFDFANKVHKALFMQEMCKSGILTGYSNMVMADHTEQDLLKIMNAMKHTVNVITKNLAAPEKALQGDMPVEALRLR